MSRKSSRIYRHMNAFQPSLFDSITSDFNIQPEKTDDSNPLQKLYRRKSLSRKNFPSTYTNFCSNQIIEGNFFICQGFLTYNNVKVSYDFCLKFIVQEEISDDLIFLQNISYARFHSEIYAERFRIVFNKDEAFFELEFSEAIMFNAFLTEIRKVCICTDFEEKYKVRKLLEEGTRSKVNSYSLFCIQ